MRKFAEVIADAHATIEAIRSGELHPFAGYPIILIDQSGNEIIGAGATLSDGDLLGMNYYVMGVEGSLPQ